MELADGFLYGLRDAVGAAWIRTDPASRETYGQDALGQGHPPDLVVLPADTPQVAAVVRLCAAHRVAIVVRGAGTGYTGGAVPTHGGVLLSMERMNRILEIDEVNLLAVVEPNVITGELQRAVEERGLFYPPDPASLERSALGGNVAESAGGPRAFKYGTTRRYVLALEAVLPTGEVIHTGSKAVKNVVGYDLTQLLVGSEGTLAIVTKITVRLVPKPSAQATLLGLFDGIDSAVRAVSALIRLRAVPAAIELVDADSLRAVHEYLGQTVVPREARAALVIEVDGSRPAVADEIERVAQGCVEAGAVGVVRAETSSEREQIWALRRQLSLALQATGRLKINHDVVVPRGRVPELFAAIAEIKRRHALHIACFGHAGDGNIHVNIMVDPADAAERARARAAERILFERVVALEGSITGEHGIGFAKAAYLGIELSDAEIALMKRIKRAFDPNGILNPGKIFP
ncbi:MAG: FAD-binding oxidoreductase [Vicinamibacterales bacterium]